MFPGLLKKSAAEAAGTFIFMLMGCGALRLHALHPDLLPLWLVPVIFGLSICMMIHALGPVSGAHFNPAVTAAFTACGRFPVKELPWYWTAQLLGALLAMLAIGSLFAQSTTYGAAVPSLSPLRAAAAEGLFTAILMLVITAVATDSRVSGTRAGLAIGMTVAVCAFIGGPLTGAVMNPARALAPALFESRMDHLWIYFAGPFAGALLAAFFYEWMCCEDHAVRKHAKGCC